LVALRQLDDASVDAVVTDPPAGIEFMGKEWDSFKKKESTTSGQQTESWGSMAEGKKNPYAREGTPRYRGKKNESLRGFQDFICEVFTEVYRVLKPGGHAVVWALPRTSHHTAMGLERAGFDIRDNGTYLFHVFGSGFPKSRNLAGEWEGWGTALKPAVEFWIVARKPVDGTVAENVLAHGTGALNIDGCRIGAGGTQNDTDRTEFQVNQSTLGRWPAHLILDEGAAATMGEPSRFFYVPKANKRDKDEGLDDLPERSPGEKTDREEGSAGITAYSGSRGISRNNHPTVKSTALMSWLVRLVMPPGGLVLDPFMGSGSTGKAALIEGFSFLGIEREAEYVEIARRRLKNAVGASVDVVRLEEP
jgi:site-specific DNA-methyltransferase (adenine-specific)